MRLTRKGNNLYLSVHAPDVGDVREDFSDYTCVGDDFSICFNPNYLLVAIGTINSDMVHMKFVSAARPFFITEANVPAMLHVLMPGSLSAQDKDIGDTEEGDDF